MDHDVCLVRAEIQGLKDKGKDADILLSFPVASLHQLLLDSHPGGRLA